MKTSKIELRVSPEQKEVITKLAYDFGFDGNTSKLIKEALSNMVWQRYSTDIEKARELSRKIDA